jgi:LacI family transcriptional regulator
VVNNFTKVIGSASKDYDVTVDMSLHDAEDSEMPAWKIDGALILAKCTSKTMDEVTQLGIPYVVINGDCPPDGYSVVPDDVTGAVIAMDHLRQLGHSKIAYSGPLPPYLAGHSSLQNRHDTYLSRMRSYGLEPIFSSHDTLESAEEYIRETVLEKGVTAILAYGHMGALNLLQAAQSMGISVPERLSLISFCDEYANKIMSSGLTFIDLGSERMGKVAAELLLDQIQHPGRVSPQRIVLQEKLVVRNTTAEPSNQ